MVTTIGNYPEPGKTKILLPPTAKAGTQFFPPVLAFAFYRSVGRFLGDSKGHLKKLRRPFD